MVETELIVHRKELQSIRADGPCTFIIYEIRGNRVKVGIRAEQHVRIMRCEVDENDDTDIYEEGGEL